MCLGCRQRPSSVDSHPSLLPSGLEFENSLGQCPWGQWAARDSFPGMAGVGPTVMLAIAQMKSPLVTPQPRWSWIQVSALVGKLENGHPSCPLGEPPEHGVERSLQAGPAELGARGQGQPLSGSTLPPSGKSLSCWGSRGKQRLGETQHSRSDMLIVYYRGVSEICTNMIHGQPWWRTVSPSTKDREQIKEDLDVRRWGKVEFIEGLQETSCFFLF